MSGLWNDLVGIISQVHRVLPGAPPTKEIEKVVIKEIQTMAYSRTFIRVAGLSGALAVVMAAYGSHGFSQTDADPRLKTVYDTANKMHFLHTLALLGSPLCHRPYVVGTLLTTGMIVFSGTCYIHALTNNQSIRYVTPYGGMLLIFGWLAMIL